jgi:hypothetical protein
VAEVALEDLAAVVLAAAAPVVAGEEKQWPTKN